MVIDRRLRIAIFSNAYKPTISGVVTSVSLFRKGLLSRGHDVHVFAPEAEGFDDDEPYIFRLPALLDLTRSYEVALALPTKRPMLHAIKGIKPHLIHSQHPLLLGDLAMSYAQDLHVPLVFTFHTRYDTMIEHYVPLFADWAAQVARDVVQHYLEHCAHVIAPTESIRQMIGSDYQLDAPITVLPTPVDLQRFESADPAPVRERYHLQGKEVLMYLGRISPEKDLDFLLRAFARVSAQRPQTVLAIVGRGPQMETLQELARSLHLDRAIFVGSVPHAEVPSYLAAADLFVFPSRAETQGLVLVEAMAAGTPVVAVHATGTDDVLAGGEAGILVAGDEARFADAILGALGDTAKLDKMRQAARSIAQDYSIPRTTERLLAIYDQALSHAAAPS